MIILIVLIALLRTWETAPPDMPASSFKLPPYPLRMVGGGNCVWFVWEMAWQRWGVILPVAGHASQWTSLDGAKLRQNGYKYQLSLVDTPRENSILILPAVQSDSHSSLSLAGQYGHLAWVEKVLPGRIIVLESSIFPQQSGKHWQGCWYRSEVYYMSSLPEARFLCVVKSTPISRARSKDKLMVSGGLTPLIAKVNYDSFEQIAEEMYSYTIWSLRLFFHALAVPGPSSKPITSWTSLPKGQG